eukprot:CAMPEP_0204371218 /NCGR_PEP_ID=MMETSP0469-20131031/46326_1 /ASSEMBLY_ACC=CAM_ASM_000384 /TAXON_ID=2969 /ORGANISM="Oxyrrhis marina" /LENGTH=45 /DNA_ID= /DNA_START= /DNA_END= /DNA_ORIENTATION=
MEPQHLRMAEIPLGTQVIPRDLEDDQDYGWFVQEDGLGGLEQGTG